MLPGGTSKCGVQLPSVMLRHAGVIRGDKMCLIYFSLNKMFGCHFGANDIENILLAPIMGFALELRKCTVSGSSGGRPLQ